MRKYNNKNNNNKNRNFNWKGTNTLLETQAIGMPDMIRTKLVYSDTIILSSASPVQYSYRANSLFDPDFTSVGHQPLYFDQFIATYQRYRVYGTKMRLRILNIDSSGAELVVIPSSLIPTLTSAAMAKEQPRAVSTGPIPANSFHTVTLHQSHSTAQILGLSKSQIMDDDYAAEFSANPVQLWYYAIYAGPIGGSVKISIDVRLTFDCEFFDRAPLALSIDDEILRLSLIREKLLQQKAKRKSQTNTLLGQKIFVYPPNNGVFKD